MIDDFRAIIEPMVANIRRNWYLHLLLIAITAAVYSCVTSFDFVNYDDGVYVITNSHVKAGLTLPNIRYAFTFTQDANWIPLTWISLMLDGGSDAGVYHRTNLILHILNTLLLFALIDAITGMRWRSAMVAALFAIHPLHVESVAWVSERKDVLSTFFMMLTLLAYVCYARKPAPGRYAAVVALFALGLMSKSMLVTLPLVMLLLDFWPLGRVVESQKSKVKSGKRNRPLSSLLFPLLREKLPLFVLSAAVSVTTYLAQKHGGAVGTLEAYPLGVRLANASVSYFVYLGKMVWPVDLASLYPHPGRSIPVWQVAASAIGLAAVTLAAIRAAGKRPYLTVGWLWYAITLIPVIGIVQVGRQALADRYTYITLIGIFVAIVWMVADFFPNNRARTPVLATVAAAVILALSVRAHSQTLVWSDNITFFTHAVNVTRNNRIASHNLVLAHKDFGDKLFDEKRLDEAIYHFRKALAIDPRMAMIHGKTVAYIRNRLGTAYGMQGKLDLARAQFLAALRADKNCTDALCNLTKMALDAGNLSEAIRYAERANSVAPNNSAVRRAVAVVNSLRGSAPE